MKKNEHGLYEADIDGEKYEFEKWGAEDALDVLIDISQMVGKPLGMAIATMLGKEGLEKDVDPNMVGSVFESLFQNCNKANTKPLIKKLCSEKVMCGGKKISFDKHYEDRLMHCFKVVKANLEVQYGNFFGELLELTKLRGALLK
jgi:hypothetical protein